ncbi:MAG: hypothetical protein KKF16_00055 [Euryarchaeota archaeon]|nr:hypothetical protein [Euryarchaeota archaeon]MBU4607800.1 hypothetical protein [Euryarchaeota archaeon]MBV1755163.1 hypothetical protein [Methanobacterium sp.]
MDFGTLYTQPHTLDGIYDVLLTSTNSEGHKTQINLNFTVDNTPPEISGTVTPTIAKSGDYISINALTSSDAISVTALILGETFDLYRQSNGNWNLYYYSIPEISDGICFMYNLIFGNNIGNIIDGLLISLSVIGLISLFLSPMGALILLISATILFIAAILILSIYFF